ncbi:hypothetical protein [Streptacidiphilus melanogenes]|uniref:hypothetical protein n=1 Tax=Streptacidiphilus melanogenes TaxID=411235 RepID=UPI0005A88DF5|nr:hypothetical protein [Streptacidiphilus melanogenes]
MSWMHERASASRSRRRSPSSLPSGSPNTPKAVTALLEPAGHVGFPRLIGRRARWVTSRLRQR